MTQTPHTASPAKVLVIEDEEAIREGLLDVLRFHGYDATSAADGRTGLEMALSGRHGLILLDVMLPEIDGFSICRQVRDAIPEQPICMLTAKGVETDVLRGFECGADDYVTKPFSIKQLLARVESLLRRSGVTREAHRVVTLGQFSIDVEELHITDGIQSAELSQRDVDLLLQLSKHDGGVVSRRELLQEVWGYGRVADVETRCVDMHMVKLRRKLQNAFGESGQELIKTVRGSGYKLKVLSDSEATLSG